VAARSSATCPVWYLMAKDEGHGFRKKSNQDFQFYATILFTQRYLLGQGRSGERALIRRSRAHPPSAYRSRRRAQRSDASCAGARRGEADVERADVFFQPGALRRPGIGHDVGKFGARWTGADENRRGHHTRALFGVNGKRSTMKSPRSKMLAGPRI